jgi:iron complex outermembrane receptor protein
MSRLFSLRYVLMTGAACMAIAPAAHADDAATPAASPPTATIDEVVVLARMQQYRGDVPLKDLPQSVQVLSGELLSDVGVTRLDMALELVSGIDHQNNFGGLWDSFSVRGFSGDPNVPSGYLVNGFNGGRGFGGPRDASNIERIEVLKGPGSALFGRGEPGGTVNIITKKPKFTPEGSVVVSAGSYATYRAEGDYTAGLGDKVAFRINGAYERGDSFRDTLSSKKATLSPSILANLSDKTTVTYELEAVRQEVPFDRGVVAVNGKLGVVPNSRFLGEPGDGPMKVNVLGHQAQLSHDFGSNWLLLLGAAYRDTSMKGYSTEAELATARQKLFLDGQNLSRQRRYRDYGAKHAVLRGELDGRFSTGSFTHHVLIGVDGEHFDLDQIQNRFRPGAASAAQTEAAANSVNIFSPVYGKLPAVAAFTTTLEKQKAWGVYAQDQIDLSDHFKLRLGVRYDEFDQTITNRLPSCVTKCVTGQSISAVDPQVGLVYAPNDLLSFYASYGKGFRPNSGADVSGTPFGPERTKAYEVGAKLETADKKLSGTLALYKTDKTNIITADPINAGFSLAIGTAESKGVELDVNGELPGAVKAWLAYAYTDAQATNTVLDPDFGKLVAAGAPLLSIPQNSASLTLFKDFAVGGDSTVSLGTSVKYVGERLGETGTTFMLPAYTLVKLFAAYQPTKTVKLSAEVSNLFDKTYYPASYSRLWVIPGAPRTFTVRVGYSF